MMNKLTHEQIAVLVVKAQNGDDQAFAALYTATVDRQLYFATSFLRDSTLAEDVVQEVYIKMFNSIGKLKNPNVFVAYLNRICYNTCVDFKKKYYTQKFELDDEKLLKVEDSSELASPEEHFSLKETNNDLFEALGELSEQERSAFLLRYYHDLKIRDISQTMEISESTAKRSIKSASEKLRKLLPDYNTSTQKGGPSNA